MEHKMKASELINIVQDYVSSVMYSDAYSDVRFGCDCGCGGDTYNDWTWHLMLEDHDEALKAFLSVCERLNIEDDMAHTFMLDDATQGGT
jgi:hypothetical protein